VALFYAQKRSEEEKKSEVSVTIIGESCTMDVDMKASHVVVFQTPCCRNGRRGVVMIA
jgi:hypothetical protein